VLLILSACQAGPESAAARKPLRDFRGIIHCHSKYSHDSKGTYEEILAAAKAAKVDFICMTDHPPSDDRGRPLREGWTGVRDGVLFIQGAEYGDQILALGIKEPLAGGLDRRGKIKAIHEQGGLAIACHPEEITDWSEYDEADGMEIFNVHAAFKRKSKDKTFAFQIPEVMKKEPERLFHLLQELDPAILRKWDEINRTRPFSGIAGNDAHQNQSLFGFQLDPYPRAFKFVTTHVLAEELTQEAILGALKAGRCYVQFTEEDAVLEGRGTLEWIGTSPEVGTWFVQPSFEPSPRSGPLTTRYVKDGESVGMGDSRVTQVNSPSRSLCITEWAMKEPGNYRIEVLRQNGSPVLLTNPVRMAAKR
jgi:hypothetical protein